MADLGDKIERNWDNSTGISKVYGGFSNTTFNVGVSHERRKGSLGVDALVMSSGDNGASGPGQKDRQLLVGSSLIHHLEDNSNADVYLGTGLAIMRHEDAGETDDDETTFGPLFRIGSSYYLNNDWSVGLEYMTALNWSNDDLASENTYGFVTLGYTY
jgi:opacity protein-like surface antigen